MRGMMAGLILGMSVAMAGCAGTLSQKYAEPVTNTEKEVLKGMVQQLQSAAGIYAAETQANPQGFSNFVTAGGVTTGACRTPGGESADCAISLASFNTVSGKSCQVSMAEIRCNGSFRFYDPVVYTWSNGQISLQATPLNGAEPLQ